MHTRRAILAGALLLALTGRVEAADEQVWAVFRSKDDIRLFYGIPDSGSLTISFVCEFTRRRIAIVSTIVPPRPRAGRAVTTTLSNGSVTVKYPGKLTYDRAYEGYFFEATVRADAKVFDVLKAGPQLTIEPGGKRETVPMAGVSTPLSEMQQACLGGR